MLIVTGVYPPSIGGPATHAADVATELEARGHHVAVLTLSDDGRSERAECADGAEVAGGSTTRRVVGFPRRWHWARRSLRMVTWLATHGSAYDVVYASGLAPVAVAGARLARRPVIVKFVADPAWERATRQELSTATFDGFQRGRRFGARVRAMQWVRDWTARRASVVVTPSPHLTRAASRWGRRDDVITIPNGVRVGSGTRRRRPSGLVRLLFVGRLVPVKRVEIAIAALAEVPGAQLEIVGDGPELDALTAEVARRGVEDRVRFCGRLDHEETLRRIRDADALVLTSAHEGLPHVVLEALASGTPVIATRADGIVDAVEHGVNGLLVDDAADLSGALASTLESFVADAKLRTALRRGARASGARWDIRRCVDALERVMRSTTRRPRAVFVGKSRTSIPLTDAEAAKYAINQRHLDTVVVCTANRPGIARPFGARVIGLPDPRVPVLRSAWFYALGPALAVVLAAARRGAVVVAQSPFEGACVLAYRRALPKAVRPRVQVELHGDWRSATRLYGSSLRRVWSHLADAGAERALSGADRVRPVSRVLEARARAAGYDGPIDRFVAYSDYEPLLAEPAVPMPKTPQALFAGVMERYKGVDVLLEAWPHVVDRVPDARLLMVGSGSLDDWTREEVARRGLTASVEVRAAVPKAAVRGLLDDSTCLVLPSRSEGLPRVVLEAMARARPVVATRVGGVDELVEPGRNGWLVDAECADDLAAALTAALGGPDRATELGAAARVVATRRNPASEYESGIARLAHWIDAP